MLIYKLEKLVLTNDYTLFGETNGYYF